MPVKIPSLNDIQKIKSQGKSYLIMEMASQIHKQLSVAQTLQTLDGLNNTINAMGTDIRNGILFEYKGSVNMVIKNAELPPSPDLISKILLITEIVEYCPADWKHTKTYHGKINVVDPKTSIEDYLEQLCL